MDRSLREVDPPVLDVLSLGAHQLLGTRIPGHAAVSATVELARVVLGDGRAKFVNAVLRKISADDLDGWLDRITPSYEEDAEEHLALRHAHPRWVVSALWDALGGPRQGITELLEADNERPEVTLVARPGRATTEELLTDETLPGRWSPYAVRMAEGGEPGALDAVREGRAGVQDEGSQLVALALANAPVEGADTRWLDTCRRPGRQGRAPRRAGRRAGCLAGGGREAAAPRPAGGPQPGGQPRPLDGRHRRRHPAGVAAGSFDRVLVDVPCTGLGALRRRPEARWRRRPEDLEGFAPLQRGLLGQALEAARVGGVVAYVTCSPHPAETRAVVDDVLKALAKEPGGTAAELTDARPLLPDVPALGEGPDIQLWPHLHGTDAMYLALLRRTA